MSIDSDSSIDGGQDSTTEIVEPTTYHVQYQDVMKPISLSDVRASMRERPSLHALTVYLAVIDHKTMTAAAEIEGISQPAISMHVKALERFYGTPLIERQGRRVRPTAAGELVAEYTRQILGLTDDLSRMVADLEGLAAGRLVIGASSTVGEQLLPDVLGRFHRAHPGVGLSLQIGNSGEITHAVIERQLDIGIIGNRPANPHLAARPIFDDALECFTAPDHQLANDARITVADLSGLTFVLRERGSATRDLALSSLLAAGCSPGETIELGSNEAVKRAAAAGLGIGILSKHSTVVDRQVGAVITLPIVDWVCERQFWLIHRGDRRLSRAELAFIELLDMAT